MLFHITYYIKLFFGLAPKIDLLIGKDLHVMQSKNKVVINYAGDIYKLNVCENICIRILYFFNIFNRVLRLSIRCISANSNFVCFIHKKTIYSFNLHTGQSNIRLLKMNGSPLNMCTDGEKFFFGEYFQNNERQAVNIFCFDPSVNDLVVSKTLSKIRHVHGIFYDRYCNAFWVFTGDLDEECNIALFDEHWNRIKGIGGSQKYRAVFGVVTPAVVIYAMDTPHGINKIYSLNKANLEIAEVTSVMGSVLSGIQNGDEIFFSTCVEKSLVNPQDKVELVRIGVNGLEVSKSHYKTDLLHLKIFQYPRFVFPVNLNNEKVPNIGAYFASIGIIKKIC